MRRRREQTLSDSGSSGQPKTAFVFAGGGSFGAVQVGMMQSLASHGVGGALHEEPGHIPTWYEAGDKRRIQDGLVFTIEPFLSTGSHLAIEGGDPWTLFADGGHATVQYEHTMVATKRGAVVVTMA